MMMIKIVMNIKILLMITTTIKLVVVKLNLDRGFDGISCVDLTLISVFTYLL
jgi:hypothetical protein